MDEESEETLQKMQVMETVEGMKDLGDRDHEKCSWIRRTKSSCFLATGIMEDASCMHHCNLAAQEGTTHLWTGPSFSSGVCALPAKDPKGSYPNIMSK